VERNLKDAIYMQLKCKILSSKMSLVLKASKNSKHGSIVIYFTINLHFQMDVEAIVQASDNELLLLGLDKKGDILSLRNFVEKLSKESSNNEKRSRKMSLLHEVLENGKVKKSLKQQKDGKASIPKMRKVQLGWMHFDDEKQTFVSVRTAKGGGTREVDIKLTADKHDIIGIAKTIFFNDGNSNFGPEQLMTFGLANFQHEDISTIKVSGVHLAFTLQRYVEKCKMSRVRLYLTSKINILDDVPLLKPADHKPAASSKPEGKECGLNDDKIKSQTMSKLEERRKIISEQDAAYEESLATDRAKREKLMKEVKL